MTPSCIPLVQVDPEPFARLGPELGEGPGQVVEHADLDLCLLTPWPLVATVVAPTRAESKIGTVYVFPGLRSLGRLLAVMMPRARAKGDGDE